MDHYTLIVDDAESVAGFHQNVLGFEPIRIQKVNAGSVPDGEYDMVNYVLKIPGTDDGVIVVTQGLSEKSIFTRYLKTYGPGVHHLAYAVEDLDHTMALLQDRGIKMTSAEVLRDPLTGLRQVFLDRAHGGYFIELIERTAEAGPRVFIDGNMAALAQTMESYLGDDGIGPEIPMPEVVIARPRAEVVAFLLDPFNLPDWTAHRTIRCIGGRVVEVRMAGDVVVEVAEHPTVPEVHFVWSRADGELRVRFGVEAVAEGTRVRVLVPPMAMDRAARTLAIIETELSILKRLLEGAREPATAAQLAMLDEYHLELHLRTGL